MQPSNFAPKHSATQDLKLVDLTSEESLTCFYSEETTSPKRLDKNSVTTSACSKSSLSLSLAEAAGASQQNCLVKMPPSISKAVEQQTVNFAHNKVQFMPEYLSFVKNLVSSCQGFMMDVREVNKQGQAF